MRLAQVMGQVWGARQAPGLDGVRLLVVRPADAGAPPRPQAQTALPSPPEAAALPCFIAADALGAGPGEWVLVAHGSRCRDLTLGPLAPTKDVVVAIVDAADWHLGPEGEQ